MNERVVIVGGPLRGKSTLARLLFFNRPIYCTDRRADARDVAPAANDLNYMPDEITDWSAQSQHVADHWLTMPGPWVIEGVATARALRKWLAERPGAHVPCDRVIVLRWPHPAADPTPAQERMAKGVWTVWQEIAQQLAPITEYR